MCATNKVPLLDIFVEHRSIELRIRYDKQNKKLYTEYIKLKYSCIKYIKLLIKTCA